MMKRFLFIQHIKVIVQFLVRIKLVVTLMTIMIYLDAQFKTTISKEEYPIKIPKCAYFEHWYVGNTRKCAFL